MEIFPDAYIADYPEQVLVAGIVNGWYPAYAKLLPVVVSTVLICECSCDADPMDLDDPTAKLRTVEEREILLRTMSADDLWFQHGLVHDFRVHSVHNFQVRCN